MFVFPRYKELALVILVMCNCVRPISAKSLREGVEIEKKVGKFARLLLFLNSMVQKYKDNF